MKLEISLQNFEKCSIIDYHGNPLSGSQVNPWGITVGWTNMTKLTVNPWGLTVRWTDMTKLKVNPWGLTVGWTNMTRLTVNPWGLTVGWTDMTKLKVNPWGLTVGWRAEEHRVEKECGSTCRSRWSPNH
jgi:hypothetical protein